MVEHQLVKYVCSIFNRLLRAVGCLLFDCGVFTCMYAHYLAEDSAFNFNQVDIPIIKKKSALELVHKAHTIINIIKINQLL